MQKNTNIVFIACIAYYTLYAIHAINTTFVSFASVVMIDYIAFVAIIGSKCNMYMCRYNDCIFYNHSIYCIYCNQRNKCIGCIYCDDCNTIKCTNERDRNEEAETRTDRGKNDRNIKKIMPQMW